MEQKKILVIDDDPDVVASVKAVLKSKPYHVVAAFDGDEVPRKIIEERPDLIILDVVTPVKHCLRAFRGLRTEDRCYFCCHTILLTAYRHKPFDSHELLSLVEELLKK